MDSNWVYFRAKNSSNLATEFVKKWFHAKSQSQKISEISTLWVANKESSQSNWSELSIKGHYLKILQSYFPKNTTNQG